MPAPRRRGGATRAAASGRLKTGRTLSFAPASAWSEAQLQEQIMGYVDDLDEGLQHRYPGVPGMRMRCHHETDSRKSRAGWPDLPIAGPGGFLIAELKRQDDAAQPTREQLVWLEVLTLAGIAAFVWRPQDWIDGAIQGEIVRLSRPSPQALAVAQLERPRRRLCGCYPGQPHTCFTFGGGS